MKNIGYRMFILIFCCVFFEVSATTDWTDSENLNNNLIQKKEQQRIFNQSEHFTQQVFRKFKQSIQQKLVASSIVTFILEAPVDDAEISCLSMSNFVCSAANDEITGTVFEDYNYDGDYDLGENLGVENVTVIATDSLGNSFSDNTDLNGDFTIIALMTDRTYRIEFTNIPTWANPTFYGEDNETTVQFVQSGNCANLGLADPDQYCQETPQLVTSCYISGDNSGTEDVLVSWEYNNLSSTIGHEIRANQIGSVWGQAYSSSEEVLYTSAFLKRHAGLGPNGLGAIYSVTPDGDASNDNTPLFLDVTSLGINVGQNLIAGRTLPASTTAASQDSLAFIYTGKIGLGDLEISSDEKTLYTINLYERTILAIDIATQNVSTYSIPTNPCNEIVSDTDDSDNDSRPFGLKYYRGKLYVGVVCSGEFAPNNTAADLNAFVYEFDFQNAMFTEILQFQLDYERESPADNCIPNGQWNPWTNTWFTNNCGGFSTIYSQALLSNMEFTQNGNMVLSLMDRMGHLGGVFQFDPSGNGSNETIAGGDILMATPNGNGTFTVENQWTDDVQATEFFDDDVASATSTGSHDETAHGGLFILPGTNIVVMTSMDSEGISKTGGVTYLNLSTGERISGFEIYDEFSTPGSFAKAVGLSDIEAICNPAPIEIGNYVWEDTNNDGIQDAGENPIVGVVVSLYRNATIIAETQTSVTGQYYFSDKNATDANLVWSGLDADSTLLNNTSYSIQIRNIKGNNQQAVLSNFALTTPHANNNQSNSIDSDAVINGNHAEVIVTTGDYGSVDHTNDIGFFTPDCELIVSSATYNNCISNNDSTFTATWDIGLVSNYTTETGISYQYNSEAIQTTTLSNQQGTIQILEIVADGMQSDTLKIFFTNDTTCGDTLVSKRPVPCPVEVGTPNTESGEICTQIGATDIGGTVFEDWNYDGLMNQSDTTGVQGIKVSLIDDCNSTSQITYTDSKGNYLFTGLDANTTYRIEFELPESVSCWAKPTQAGADNGTSIQFVRPNNCASLGIASPNDFCEEEPDYFVSCFIAGARDSVANDIAILSAPYTAGSDVGEGDFRLPAKSTIATIGQVGTVWGQAYHRKSGKLLSSAFLRRFTDLGPGTGTANSDGTGTIYMTDLNAPLPNGNPFVDIDDLFGIGYSGINPHPGGQLSNCTDPTPSGLGCWTHDADAYGLVGKIGIGDIDLSEDEETLWAINIATKELLKMPIGTTATAPIASEISKFDIPSNSSLYPEQVPCGGEAFPFGIKYHQGKVYVGVTCVISQTQTFIDFNPRLFGWIYSFDPITETWKYELTVPAFFLQNGGGYYHGWATSQTSRRGSNWITDIEFTSEGNMVIAMRDHTGDQWGQASPNPDINNPTLTEYSQNGHLLQACKNSDGSFTLEDRGSCGGRAGAYIGGGVSFSGGSKGPGGGRFYNLRGIEDYMSQGAVAQLKGKDELALVSYDVAEVYDAGVAFLNNKNGAYLRRYQILNSGDLLGDARFGKASSLGDIEFQCTKQAPIQIGNYVWEDNDEDGIQDACESPIPSVNVSLYKNGTKIAETQTSATGQYYFSNKNATDTNLIWSGINVDTTLLPNMEYNIVFGESQYINNELVISSGTYSLTTQNAGTNDWIDSDATEMDINGTLFPSIVATTGDVGCVYHNFDVGFQSTCDATINLSSVSSEICGGDSTDLSLNFDFITGNIALYYNTTLLDAAIINAAGHGGATFIDSTQTGVVINEVDFIGGESVEIWNTSCETIDVSNWNFCYKFGYNPLNTATISSGDLILSPGERVAFSNLPNITMNNSSGSLGLYRNNSDFGDPDNMVDYVQWRGGGQARESVAVSKGIWTAGDFVPQIPVSNTIQYDGYGNHSSDWSFGASTFGSTNINTSNPLNTTINSGALVNGTTGPITYYFYAILTNENCNRNTTCQPVAIDSVVAAVANCSICPPEVCSPIKTTRKVGSGTN